MALSDYEREVLQFAGTSVALKGARNNEQLPDPGRATEEQLKRISRALAGHLPRFFTEPHIYSLYNRNIVFRNNIRGITTRLEAWQSLLFLLLCMHVVKMQFVKKLQVFSPVDASKVKNG